MTNPPSHPKALPAVLKRYRIRQQPLPVTKTSDSDTLSVTDVASDSGWTRGSLASSFIDGELGSTFGRLLRSAGRIVIDPIDTFIGLREFGKLYVYVTRLDAAGWKRFKIDFDVEAYTPRVAEVLRHGVYPLKLQLLAQKLALAFAILGKVQFGNVIPRIHFRTKEEFLESIADLSTTSLNLLPKSTLLLHIPLTEDDEDFLSSLRRKINQSPDEMKDRAGLTLSYCAIDQTLNTGARPPESDQEQDVETLRVAFWEEHPKTLPRMHNLAVTYYQQGRLNDAEKLCAAVLENRRWHLGEKHPDTLSTMHNLATAYHKQGRLNEAEDLNVTVLENKIQILGEIHPDTLNTMHNLALTYRKQQRLNDAERLYVLVLERRNQIRGENHPDTLSTMHGLAVTYFAQGRLNEAERLDVAVLEKRKKLLGHQHPDTLATMHNLAWTYLRQGQLEKTEHLLLDLIGKSMHVYGQEHQDTRGWINLLADVYCDQGRFKDAEKLEAWVTKQN